MVAVSSALAIRSPLWFVIYSLSLVFLVNLNGDVLEVESPFFSWLLCLTMEYESRLMEVFLLLVHVFFVCRRPSGVPFFIFSIVILVYLEFT